MNTEEKEKEQVLNLNNNTDLQYHLNNLSRTKLEVINENLFEN